MVQTKDLAAAPDLAAAEAYIHSTRTPDGGYFFARIPPAGGLDTLHAVSALSILRARPRDPAGLRSWLIRWAEAVGPGDRAAFVVCNVLRALGEPISTIRSLLHRLGWRPACRWEMPRHIFVETTSALESLYERLSVQQTLGIEPDAGALTPNVLALRNGDGSFSDGGSQPLAATYFAVAVLRMLGTPAAAEPTEVFVRGLAEQPEIHFLDDLRWLAELCQAFDIAPRNRGALVEFVAACQRPGGGFARSPVIGIPTLEYTYYALRTLQCLRVLG